MLYTRAGDAKTPTNTVDFDSVIVRFGGEIWTKKTWTRRQYERLALHNIKRVMKFHNFPVSKVIKTQGRLFIKTEKAEKACQEVAKVFGISSVSPALETSSKPDDLVEKNLLLANERLKNRNTFAVKCRRVGSHPYGSRDICRVVGQQILEKFGEKNQLKVNLTCPDITFGIDIRDNISFIYDRVVEGQGGLPLGAQSRLVGLLNSEINSVTACWLAMKRGCPIIPLYFDNAPYTDENMTERAIDHARTLFDWAIGFPRHMYVVSNGQNLKKIAKKCPNHLTCLLCKRMMYKTTEKIAEMFRAEGIATGETIGTQESPNLHDLSFLSQAARQYPIHRPLLGFEKQEIEKLAIKIGIYPSPAEKKVCASKSTKPKTKIKLQEIIEAEKKLDIEKMIDRSMKSLKVLSL
jgi:thiamine biosynthesis protein ThiI